MRRILTSTLAVILLSAVARSQGVKISVTETIDTTSTLTGLLAIIAPADSASAYTVTAADCRRGTISNTNQTQNRQYNLPAAVPGYVVRLVVNAAFTMKAEPNGSDLLRGITNAAGDSITSDTTLGAQTTLDCTKTGEWNVTVGPYGSWADSN